MKDVLGRNGGGNSNYRLLVTIKDEKIPAVMDKLRKIEDILIENSVRLTALELKLKK